MHMLTGAFDETQRKQSLPRLFYARCCRGFCAFFEGLVPGLIVAQNSHTDALIAIKVSDDLSKIVFFESEDGFWSDVIGPYVANISTELNRVLNNNMSEEDLIQLVSNTVDGFGDRIGAHSVKFLDSEECSDPEIATTMAGKKGVWLVSVDKVKFNIDSKSRVMKLSGESVSDCSELIAFIRDRGREVVSIIDPP